MPWLLFNVGKIPMMPNTTIIWQRLAVLRGLAAVYVLFHHIRNAMWWATRDVSQASEPLLYWINLFLGAVFRFGLTAVLAFFVVSGVNIHLATLERRGYFSVRSYFLRRAQRLYPVLIASMAISALCQIIVSPSNFFQLHTFLNAIGTLAFQQTILVDQFAGNSPYWSLANEGYYYALYPLLLIVCSRIGVGLSTFLVFIAGIVLTSLFRSLHPVIAYAPLWVGGVFLAHCIFKQPTMRLQYGRAGTLLVIASLLNYQYGDRISFPNPACIQLLGGLGLALLIANFLRSKATSESRWGENLLAKLGDVSFPLYVTHFPLVSLIDYWIPNTERSIFLAIISSLVATALALAVAFLVHQFVEAGYLKRSKQERSVANLA